MAFLTDRTLATGVTPNDLIHIVVTGDTSQNPAGSSFKATMGQVLDLINPTTITGGTYNPITGDITFTNSSGGTFVVTGLVTGYTNTAVTAFTYNNANTFMVLENDGSSYSASINVVTGLTINGNLNVTGTTSSSVISATTYYNVSTNFQYEIHVSQVDGNDTTGNGDLLNPVATIAKALTLLTGSRKTIIVHPGTYTENVMVANTNTTIATSELTGANTLLSGTLTIGTLGSGSRISGLKMTNLVISGTAQAYISNCTIDTQVTKSSSGYVEIINTEMQCISGITISGAGIIIINGNKNVGVSVSNASAQVIIKGCNSVVTPSASAGNLAIVDCIVTALGGNAITITNSATTLTLLNSQVLVQAGNNVAPISVAGIYSIINTIYDKLGSTFTGTSANSIDYFQFINADKFITQGGTSLQYVMGDGSLSSGFTGGTITGPTIFTSGLTANTISASTYQNLPTDVRVTGATYSNNTFTYTNNTGGTFSVLFNTMTGLTINGDLNVTGTIFSTGSTQFISTTGITISAVTLSTGTTYNGINYAGNVDLTIPSPSGFTGLKIIIKDESGNAGTYRIRLTPSVGTIDGNPYVDMNINYMSLTLVARNNNWWII
jgi:hypothetical protein